MSFENDSRAMSNGQLPEELSALEAQLASLIPRRDRLEQERFWFEAGRRAALDAATTGSNCWAIASSSVASATVAIAATLLVMLWMRPQTKIVERIEVETPAVQRADREPPRSAEATTRGEQDRGEQDQRPMDQGLIDQGETDRRGTERRVADGRMDISAPTAAAGARGSRAAQLETLALLLRHGSDGWDPPASPAKQSDQPPSTTINDPPTYYQQRQDLLGDQASRGSHSRFLNTFARGA